MPPQNEPVTSPSRVPVPETLVEREPILQTMEPQQVSHPSPQTAKELRVFKPNNRTQSHPLSPTDGLTTLPPELLTQIFELVRIENGDSQKLTGISRSLIYYTEVNLYRQVSITSLESLKLFARTIGAEDKEGQNLDSKTRAQYIASLVEYFEFGWSAEYDLEEGWEDFDGAALFGALSNVKEIVILSCSPLMTTLTSLDCATQPLQRLKSVELEGIVRAGEDPFIMGRFIHLAQYGTLDTLDLSFLHWPVGENEKADLPFRYEIPTSFCLPVKHLTLGPHFYGTSSGDLATFLSYFPSLETLSIDDRSNRLDFGTVLENTNTALLHLSVDREDDSELEVDLEFGEVLARFTSLKSFALKNAALDDITVLAVQRCTEIELLTIKGDSSHSFPTSALQELLHPRARPSSLKELKLDSYVGKEGENLSRLEELPKTDYERWQRKWQLPSWKEGFTFQQAKDFVSMALENGVTVTGDIVENIRIQNKWDELVEGNAKRKMVSGGNEGNAKIGGEVA